MPWLRKPGTPAYHEAFLARRWAEGATAVLLAVIRQRGYTGSYSHLARFLAPWRNTAPSLDAMPARPPPPSDHEAAAKRSLQRIEGQVRGLLRMVEEHRYCIDIITQISAVRAALKRVEEQVLKDHVNHCVANAITSGDKEDQRRKVAELMDVIGHIKP
jgi:DNA-binding FrmR family transcriptional regulator